MPAETTSGALKGDRVIPFRARDGVACNVIHVTGARTPDKGPVLLVHGAGVRGNIFRAPVKATVVDLLLEAGYDVWLENWRASTDLPAHIWTIDQAALYDHPAAVEKVVEETGATELKAIVHCQGSTSFCLSAVMGLVPQVSVIVSNAVALHPVVPPEAWLKLKLAVPLLAHLTPYVNPQWGVDPPTMLARALTAMVRLTHHECDNIVCRWASFAYGVGFPTLWRHENLNDATHEWLKAEFAAVPLLFFEQMRHCVDAGHLVPEDVPEMIPSNPVAEAPRTDARFALFAGELNRCFLPESQRLTHEWLESHRPGYHTLHVVPEYAHLDPFMGQHAYRDVLPLMIQELDKPR
ncbi:MAG TPA: alpha/beta fold hydrolase [Longimicrobiaceae bacterium]|nr:alpha/beta fold hydrolase [Longimicrobiaceae bacterium]